MAPWKMLPPVSPKRRSMSKGERTWRAITDLLKLGAYSSRISKQRSAYFSFSTSQSPSRRFVGAYWVKMDIRCLPGGATVGSTTEGMVHSSMGDFDHWPYFASSKERSM